MKRYQFGNPIETDAVLEKPELCKGTLPFMKQCENGFSYEMTERDIVYGLGEAIRGINKRGWIYESNCTDEPNQTEEKRSLYGAHNFFIVSGREQFGIFFDTPGKVTFDIGYTSYSQIFVRMEEMDCDVYIIEGASPEEIVKEFRGLIGQSYLPPKWAFGFGQSRWSYETAAEVRELVKNYRENHVPIDMVYLDIDYMEQYKDFTIDEERFPNFQDFVEEMKQQNIRLIPIIDAGVKVEKGYDVYEEGMKNGYFCKDEDGNELVAGVWPGKCHFPDMLNEEARNWFGNKYQVLLQQGIEGFWNDMNEPAIFYSGKRLEQVFEKMQQKQGKNLDIHSFFELQGLVSSMANNAEDYRSFYHNYKGQKIRHDRVHNLFGYNMTRAAGEALERLVPEKRTLLFSRASYIGMHRYGGIWTGDNESWWSHLLMNLKMMPSLNMCGFLYTGADLGGFGADTTMDLMLRWLALGIFMPLMRNHSAAGTRRQEITAFDSLEEFCGILRLRYRLIPYLYSEFMKAALGNTMYARPLGFVWQQDEIARHVEDQLLIGESIMIAPVYEQNAIGRNVYLPEEMKLLRFKGEDCMEEQILPKGYHFIEIGLDEVVMFLRKGHMLPLAEGGECVSELEGQELALYHFAEAGATYELYEDDGLSREINSEENLRTIVLG